MKKGAKKNPENEHNPEQEGTPNPSGAGGGMEVITPEVLPPVALEQISRAEIDIQIATAHRYPRSLQLFKNRAMGMATLDIETAQSCIYRRPVGKKYNPKTQRDEIEYAEGKSVRMAEIVGASYGNLRAGSFLVEQTERYVKARGFAHDLETNFASTSEVVEPTVDRHGNPYSERMRAVVAKAALAKARRDATFQVVPSAICKSIEDSARKLAIGTSATLSQRRAIVIDWINKLGIDPHRVWGALKIAGPEDIGLEQLETLTGIRTAIKDGDTTPEEAFPQVAAPPEPIIPPSPAEPKEDPALSPVQGPAASELVDLIFDKSPDINTVKSACRAVGIDFQQIRSAPEDALRKVLKEVEKRAGA